MIANDLSLSSTVPHTSTCTQLGSATSASQFVALLLARLGTLTLQTSLQLDEAAFRIGELPVSGTDSPDGYEANTRLVARGHRCNPQQV